MPARRVATWEPSPRVSAPPPAPVTPEGSPRVDPREREDWFRRLDPDAQDAVRERWVLGEATREAAEERVQRHQREWYGTCVALFAGTQAVVTLVLGVLLSTFTGGASFGVAAAQVLVAALYGVGVAFLSDEFELEQLGLAVLCMLAGMAMGVTQLMLGIGWFATVFPTALMLGSLGGYLGAARSGPLAH